MERFFRKGLVRPMILTVLVGLVCLLSLGGTAWASLGDAGSSHYSGGKGTVPQRLADVRISKSGRWVGNEVTFTIRVTNNGPVVAQNVAVSDRITSDLTYRSSSSTAGKCISKSGLVNCVLGNLPVGGQVTIVIQTRVKKASTRRVSNTAVVGASTPDPSYANNVASVTVNK